MKYRGEFILGGFLVLFGLLLLISNILGIDFWAICGPLGLILLGVWLICRQQIGIPGPHAKMRPFGDINRHGEWMLEDEEIWMFIGDIRLDLTRVVIPDGLTTIRILAFVSDINLLIPNDLDYSISGTTFLTEEKFLGKKRDIFFSPYKRTSENYQSAETKIHIEFFGFVADLDIDII